MKRNYLNITLILVFVLLTKAFGQDQKALADSLFESNNMFDAITEYKRLLFFDKNGDYSFTGNFWIGECYKAGAKLDEAIEYFSKSLYHAKSDSQIFASKIALVRANLLRRTVDRAEQILKEVEDDYRFADSTDQIYYWKGWLMVFADNWKRAAYYFDKSIYSGELKNICERTEKQLYSVTKAKVLSYILPGSGQFYSGNYISGILSLGWVSLWGYLTVDAFVANRIFDGFVIGDLLLLRFYRGNIQNAEKFAVEKNNEIINKSLNYIQENYTGIRP